MVGEDILNEDDETPEERAESEARWAARRAAEAEARRRQERAWARKYPREWGEWERLQPLLNPFFDFGADKPFDFDDFLMEVGRSRSAGFMVVRVDETLPY